MIGQSMRTCDDARSANPPPVDGKLPPIEVAIRNKLAELLNTPPDQLDFSQPIHGLGLGSLAAAALKSYVESNYH